MSVLTSLPEWKELSKIAESVKSAHMRDWFASDGERAEKMSLSACGIYLDYSKNRVNEAALSSLFDLARACNIETIRTNMFEGEQINSTEGRAVLHTALRNFSNRPVMVDGKDVMPEVHATLEKMKGFTESIHSGEHKGYTGKPIKHIVAIGIGGSFLGPKIMTEALKPHTVDTVKVHFVANVDGCHIHDVLSGLNFEETLVVMSSKSFTTQETLQNTLTAKDWFLKSGGTQQDIGF
jgi:glucose-6-phosphate isomerase